MSNSPENPSAEGIAVLRAIRVAMFIVVLGICHFNIRWVLSIQGFELIFKDMLSGRSLPVLTTFVIQYSTPLAWVACVAPAFAASALFVKRLSVAFYLLAGGALLAFVEMTVLREGLFAPLLMIIRAMSGVSP